MQALTRSAKTELVKDFQSIQDDYFFFESHSNEREIALLEMKKALSRWVMSNSWNQTKNIQILDFGSGDGLFLKTLLEDEAFNSFTWCSTLIEPNCEARANSECILKQVCSDITSLPHLDALSMNSKFDVIVSNHSLYYTEDIYQTVARIYRSMKRNSLFIANLATIRNDLVEVCRNGYERMRRHSPFFFDDSLSKVLKTLDIEHSTSTLYSLLKFSGHDESKKAIARFIFGNDFKRLNNDSIMDLFSAYEHDGEITMNLIDRMFVIEKK